MLDELGDSAVVFELGSLRFARLRVGLALVGQSDYETLVQEGQFANSSNEHFVFEFDVGKDLGIWLEGDFRARF